ncbi:hypothetical protein J1792_21065 [Streptomyces triculaminicus]|uniref:Uncharacterized protein n=3 Tax=Streptomyces TaxID=1883 RepID=A0A939JND2_9ACTN|nr:MULTISPECIES: hypothetical protein [Streptomyces]MBO0655181.1 hypothetical protein [Streptomyces triculaminicus]QSY50957.1 hypothetical protein J3S04_08645 [Streptomyces griseocarneus]
MKLRHVRAAAVFGICVVALTGARGHHGGSCGGGSSHSSSSSSGGSSTTTSGGTTTGGDSSSGGTFGGGTTTGGTTSGGTTTSGTSGDSTTSGGTSTIGGGSGSGSAMSDIKIRSCEYTDRLGITAKIEATNSSATQKYDYRLTVKFYGPDRELLGTRNPSIPFVGPGKTDTLDVSQPFVPKAGTSGTVRCEVSSATRTAG